ncbi:1-(5-phosphoribosyl)-5-[(5-phosphoribosylamino)methylideneamino]imidazole-4-carboxamide isomerase [Gluconobacter sphaericus]|uniref:1-(5-phosphoribosyl)-5-[(5- phosphoribosylamino)methylideneamino]imidazole-4- carboxamide isomerase n=1 Tax=Gluconobacter sphaericus TaxID=574987 RepID=UPI0019206A08|nr:1-(5-phosphoribosyl)-5-[(5-phosphoribosylamino)methylideneamino]imidazole-4-carboxamide isomerase [Gluconobacter sphaericus]QQX91583.1 1-(5-phosphoribosyl)-5-[(5-phosphoribosylamino)methylideneamino]imidazole-4-carboxamide isomerase [Gluconobacter sphaericus]
MTITCERVVSPLLPEDLDALIEATSAGILDGGGFGWLQPPGHQALTRYFEGLLLVPERSFYVVRENGVICGAGQLVRPPASYEAHAATANLTGFFVAPYARGRGLGRALLETMLKGAKAIGCKVVNCDIRETHVAAIGLFRSFEFEHWGTHPYYARIGGQTVRGLFLSKLLANENEAARWQSSIAMPDTSGATSDTMTNTTHPAHGLTLYPAIDLKDGACVRLRRGEMEDATHYSDDPGAQAKLFAEAGCRHLHVVDLNGAFAGRSTNIPAIESIVKATNLPVQLGGGIRDMAAIERWLEAGVSRVILGSVAVKDPELVRQAARAFPGRIVAGIDARQGRVATEGWAEVSELEANDLALRMEDAGVAAVIFTEITRDGMLAGLDLEQTADMARRLSIPVIASGGVGSLEHLKALRDVARDVPGISGAIVGRALYDGRISLKDALEVLGPC